MEVKYVATCETTKKAVWLKKFLMAIEEVHASAQSLKIYCENGDVVKNAK